MERTLAMLVLACFSACRTDSPPEARTVEERGGFTIVHLQHADCTEIAATINGLLQSGEQRFPPAGFCSIGPPPWPDARPTLVAREPHVFADPVSNRLVVRASPAEMPRVVELITRLDVSAFVLRQE